MYRRPATKTRPARVCWRYHDGECWRERAVSVTVKNLRKHGVVVADSAHIGERHARRLQSALERL